MTKIEEIRARLRVATPGPWATMAGAEWNVLAPGGYRIAWCRISDHENGTLADMVNAKLIANAPTDIAYLLSEITRLESQVAAATENERQRCLEALAAEPELPGDPPRSVLDSIRIDSVGVLRATVRATKNGIKKRILTPTTDTEGK